jgi:rod shape-determining protein MreD
VATGVVILPSWARAGLVVFVGLMFQLAVFNRISIWSVTGQALVVLPVAAGLVGGPERGALVGFATGLAFDAFLTTPFGLNALVWTITGFAVGVAGRNLMRSSSLSVVAFAALAAPLSIGAFVPIGLILGQDQLLAAPIIPIMVVSTVETALVVPLATPAMRWALVDARDPVRHRR